MRNSLRALAVALTLLGTTGASVNAHDPAQHGFSLVTFKRVFPAPEFTTASLDGTEVSLSAYRGRYVLLNFWATWCPPCLEEMPSMQALYQEFSARGLVVVAVSSDREGASVVKGFIDELAVTFPILLDPRGEVAARYGAKNLPVSFLIDAEGQVVAAAQGARDWASPEARSVISEMLPPS